MYAIFQKIGQKMLKKVKKHMWTFGLLQSVSLGSNFSYHFENYINWLAAFKQNWMFYVYCIFLAHDKYVINCKE